MASERANDTEAERLCFEFVTISGKVGTNSVSQVRREIRRALKCARAGQHPFPLFVDRNNNPCAICAAEASGRSAPHGRHSFFCATRKNNPSGPEVIAISKCRETVMRVYRAAKERLQTVNAGTAAAKSFLKSFLKGPQYDPREREMEMEMEIERDVRFSLSLSLSLFLETSLSSRRRTICEY